MLQMFVLALSLYNTWNRGVFLLCKITNLLIYSNFYKEIMKTTDPLARYRREKSSYKAVEDVKYIRYTEGGEGEQLQYQNVNSKSDDGEGLRLVNIILKFLIIMGISLAVVLFIMLMIS